MRLPKLSQKGSSNARSLGSAAIGGTKRAEKCLLVGPQGYALDASEAFRTVSLKLFGNPQPRARRLTIRRIMAAYTNASALAQSPS
jgi:hypothetical protein